MVKIGDIVWVNEFLSGKLLKHQWYGRVTSIKNGKAGIEDRGDGSPRGEILTRRLENLELKK